MHTKLLTKTQQTWLDHFNKATDQNLSMSTYAKKNNLALPAFYHARSVLIKKEVLQKSPHLSLIPLTATPVSTKIVTTSCRIIRGACWG
ncbi:hypothetical protein [Psychromonas hadalis]|uniref:hypothetical protein n=1 Tax=Psychromonas hadalis TaxID=211669 RepID=UPI0003B5F0A3|nr:hypothetical protein [Psychromonas hadalis]